MATKISSIFSWFRSLWQETIENHKERNKARAEFREYRDTVKRAQRVLDGDSTSITTEDIWNAEAGYKYITEANSSWWRMFPGWVGATVHLSRFCLSMFLACFLVYKGIVLLDEPLRNLTGSELPISLLCFSFFFVIDYATEFVLEKAWHLIIAQIARSRIRTLEQAKM